MYHKDRSCQNEDVLLVIFTALLLLVPTALAEELLFRTGIIFFCFSPARSWPVEMEKKGNKILLDSLFPNYLPRSNFFTLFFSMRTT
jgi:hypothetical protein